MPFDAVRDGVERRARSSRNRKAHVSVSRFRGALLRELLKLKIGDSSAIWTVGHAVRESIADMASKNGNSEPMKRHCHTRDGARGNRMLDRTLRFRRTSRRAASCARTGLPVPAEALREIVINAVIHRDVSNPGSYVDRHRDLQGRSSHTRGLGTWHVRSQSQVRPESKCLWLQGNRWDWKPRSSKQRYRITEAGLAAIANARDA